MMIGLRVVGSTEGNEREHGTYENKVTEGEEKEEEDRARVVEE
jgi:hypothetical protein